MARELIILRLMCCFFFLSFTLVFGSSFTGLLRLKSLTLSGSAIASLPDSAFSGMDQLTNLVLDHTPLSSLANEVRCPQKKHVYSMAFWGFFL